MTYVISDLHGYSLKKFQRGLEAVGFSKTDKLYVLGDCIDRGTDGLDILRWISQQPNITLLLGNHEAMLLDNQFLFETDEILTAMDLTGEKRKSYCIWTSNGGYGTIDAMRQFNAAQTKYLISFLERAPKYEEITVGEKTYILTHSGLGNFSPEKPLSEYTRDELVWTRPTLDTRYYEDGRIVIFGHTATVKYGPEHTGKPVFTDTWIDIDVGAGMGQAPLLLRLDDLKEFYL